MGKRIGEDRTQVGRGRRSHCDIAGEAVKRAKNADSVTAVDTVSPVELENTVTLLPNAKRTSPEPREMRDGYPEHGTGFSRRNESVPSVQRLW
jgi:hypothetical protein